jgi:hypothetical protein
VAGVVVGAALALAPPAVGETIVALTTSNALETFNSATPGTVTAPVPITGLAGGESLVGIDFRPLTGALVGVSNQSRMYQISTGTGVATQIGMNGSFTLSGNEFGMDVNPMVDRIRVVSDTDQNLRLNPSDGTLSATDTPLAYAMGDTNAGQNPTEVALAYSNNFVGAGSTTLYGIDSGLDILVTQSPANAGTLNTVGALGVDTVTVTGFDISPGGTAFAMLKNSPAVAGSFYTINLGSGAATLVGAIGGVSLVRDIAVAPPPTAVRVTGFSARRVTTLTLVRWRAAAGRILGFHVYRETRGGRVRLDRALIPAAFAAGGAYRFVDARRARPGTRYLLEVVALDGSRSWAGTAVAA